MKVKLSNTEFQVLFFVSQEKCCVRHFLNLVLGEVLNEVYVVYKD
jgi:hypothetical protein